MPEFLPLPCFLSSVHLFNPFNRYLTHAHLYMYGYILTDT